MLEQIIITCISSLITFLILLWIIFVAFTYEEYTKTLSTESARVFIMVVLIVPVFVSFCILIPKMIYTFISVVMNYLRKKQF